MKFSYASKAAPCITLKHMISKYISSLQSINFSHDLRINHNITLHCGRSGTPYNSKPKRLGSSSRRALPPSGCATSHKLLLPSRSHPLNYISISLTLIGSMLTLLISRGKQPAGWAAVVQASAVCGEATWFTRRSDIPRPLAICENHFFLLPFIQPSTRSPIRNQITSRRTSTPPTSNSSYQLDRYKSYLCDDEPGVALNASIHLFQRGCQ